jgi:hypothetical protein
MKSDSRNLAENASNQSRAANRILIAVLTVSFLILVGGGSVTPEGSSQNVQVPFLGVEVKLGVFLNSSLPLLSLLMIVFASAQMQAHLALVYAHRQIDTARDESCREEFDRYLVGTLSRVAPIDQALANVGVSHLPRRIVYIILKFVCLCFSN